MTYKRKVITMPITHKKKFGIYHWDTFDNKTFLVEETDTLDDAKQYISTVYEEKLHLNGADRVEIMDLKGNVIERFNVN